MHIHRAVPCAECSAVTLHPNDHVSACCGAWRRADDGGARAERLILNELDGRVRDIKIAGDGAIWFLVQEGRLVRLSRESKPPSSGETPGRRSGRQIYEMVCGGCHSTDMPGSPELHVDADWEESRKKTRAELYETVLQGSGAMPPRGLCETCSDGELQAAVDFIMQSVK